MQVTLFSTKIYEKDFFESKNKKYKHQITFLETPLNYHSINSFQGCDAICVFVNDILDKDILNALSSAKIKIIALRCAGFNNVDIIYADKLNIPVVRVSKYSPNAVAEHTLALLLALNRKTHRAYNRVREGNFSLQGLMGFDLYRKTVGVIGTGAIGTIFAKIMKALGARVFAYDMYYNQNLNKEGVEYLPFMDLIKVSDIISLHIPLNPDTYHILDNDTISKMKTGVVIINTSRGALLDSKAVISNLKNGKIGSLGIDVYEQEADLFFQDLSDKIIQDDIFMRLTTFPNVLITAHQAFFTQDAMEQIADVTLRNLYEFERGDSLSNQVSVDMVLKSTAERVKQATGPQS